MTLSVAPHPHVGIVALHGSCFGLEDGPALREALAAQAVAGRPDVVLDLSSATHLDSAAIGVLIEEATALRALGGELRLAAMGGAMRNEPLLARLLGQVFSIYRTVGEAVEAVADDEDARCALGSAALSA